MQAFYETLFESDQEGLLREHLLAQREIYGRQAYTEIHTKATGGGGGAGDAAAGGM